jgi:iron-sulfur cluster repair protein YtfE (RIC family)
MKRHPSLAHLSRDHHGALILAKLLQKDAPAYKGLPTDTTGKAVYAIDFYKRELIKHFEAEEKALSMVKGTNTHLDALVQTIFEEHQQLHKSFNNIVPVAVLPGELDEIGLALEKHVRKEERELFPLIESTCTEAILSAIDKYLSPQS